MAEEGKCECGKKFRLPNNTEHFGSVANYFHPWLTWKDSINLRALNNNTGTIHMSNLCTEICLPQDKDNIAVCNLASINIAAHLNKKQIDWQKLEESARLAIRQLDNLIDINKLPVPEAERSDKENRAIGLGVMGFLMPLNNWECHTIRLTLTILPTRFLNLSATWLSMNQLTWRQERGSYQAFSTDRNGQKGKVPIDTIERLEQERGVTIDVDKKSNKTG
jgi:ribonucleoside-diphosphate reductase alpha chain